MLMLNDKLKKILCFVLGVIILVGLILGVGYSYNSRETVGKVANNKIHKNEFVFVLKTVRNTLEQSTLQPNATKEDIDKFWNSVIEGKTASEKAEDIALDEIKKLKIQEIKAKEENITLTKEEKDQNKREIDEMIEKLGGKVSAEEKINRVYGISSNAYRKIREDMKMVEKYANLAKENLNVTDEEVRNYYDENYENGDRVTVRHILISTVDKDQNDVSEETMKEKEGLAYEILEKINNGENFEELVKQYTEDTASKETLGQYTFTRGQMVPEFEEWAFSSEPGSTGVVKTNYGYHVMVKPTFEVLKDQVKDYALEKKYNESIDELSKLPEYDLIINEKGLQNVRNIIAGQ